MKFPLNVLKKITDHLNKEKSKVVSNMSSLKSQDPFSDPDRLNDNAASDTDAKEEISHERMEALEKELRLHLEEIEQALARIKRGTYGRCLSCHKMIDTDRLAIKPTALYCVECEKKREK
ncbi:TraR/DksA family transcriptional regulator [Patescibacteria group bacterium]|nr:TraR/DksA family transcriptional regulator [Patescibacteria group bacterium]MCL5797529.1 TraR/DksA family transcriptional regulator [Patescibacteria group bacterium]